MTKNSAKSARPVKPVKSGKPAKLKILAGKYKGREILAPGSPTHPMGSREKLALMNMLAPYLENAKVLDYFAGSGALGLEALSRGAKSAVFVENNPKAIKTIEKNLIGFSDNKGFFPVKLLRSQDFEASPRFPTKGFEIEPERGNFNTAERTPYEKPADFSPPFNVIISDPPYDNYQVPNYADLLKPGGILALSHPKTFDPQTITGLTFLKTHRYAACNISLFTK